MKTHSFGKGSAPPVSWQMRIKLALGAGWLMALYVSYFFGILVIPFLILSSALRFFTGTWQLSASDWLFIGALFPAAILGMIVGFAVILWGFSFRFMEGTPDVESITSQGVKPVAIGLGGMLLIHSLWSAVLIGAPIPEGLIRGALEFPLRDLLVFHGIFLLLYIAYFVFFWLWHKEQRKDGNQNAEVTIPNKDG